MLVFPEQGNGEATKKDRIETCFTLFFFFWHFGTMYMNVIPMRLNLMKLPTFGLLIYAFLMILFIVSIVNCRKP